MSRFLRLRAPLGRILKDQSGTVSVETVLWMPLILLVLYMIADVSLVFHRQSEILRQIQANNRAYATGRISKAALQSNMTRVMRTYDSNPQVTITENTALRMLTTTVSVEAENLMAVGAFGLLNGTTLDISASHLTEL